jgi:glutamine synthetase
MSCFSWFAVQLGLKRGAAKTLDAMAEGVAAQSWFGATFPEAYLRHMLSELATLIDLEPDELCDRYAEVY